MSLICVLIPARECRGERGPGILHGSTASDRANPYEVVEIERILIHAYNGVLEKVRMTEARALAALTALTVSLPLIAGRARAMISGHNTEQAKLQRAFQSIANCIELRSTTKRNKVMSAWAAELNRHLDHAIRQINEK